ncbi:MAG: hypothetical protein HY905_23810 [Deltaproteobacteria bacterium]|nr:hypothetical protein [Deltaproteobacteria bacterium]
MTAKRMAKAAPSGRGPAGKTPKAVAGSLVRAAEPAVEFGSPFNWCDSRCDRCAVTADCTVHAYSARLREGHILRGEDPDSMSSALQETEDALLSAMAQLTQMATKAGISPEEFEDDGSPAPEPVHISREAWRYLEAVLVVVRGPRKAPPATRPEPLGEAGAAACLISAKIARVEMPAVAADDEDADAIWYADSVPNLLLVESLEAQVSRIVSRVAAANSLPLEPFTCARAALHRSLRPLFDRMPDRAREELRLRIAARRAPSPFVVLDPLDPRQPDAPN